MQDGGHPERVIRNAVDTLVDLTHNLGIATIGNQLYMSGGLSNLFGQPEFIGGSQAPGGRTFGQFRAVAARGRT